MSNVIRDIQQGTWAVFEARMLVVALRQQGRAVVADGTSDAAVLGTV